MFKNCAGSYANGGINFDRTLQNHKADSKFYACIDFFNSLLVRRGFITKTESKQMKKFYPTGFNVHFQPIDKSETKALYRTAQYLASGFFHNSMITKVDHENKLITIKHRSRLNMKTRE